MGKRKRKAGKRRREAQDSGLSSDEEATGGGSNRNSVASAVRAAQRKRYETEKPLCCMCLELAVPPVFSPCDCANLSCLQCFKTYIEKHGSACVACRRRLVGSMRRGGGVESLVDTKLGQDIRRRYPNGDQSEHEEEQEELNRKRRHVAPEKGELLAQISEMNAKYESERRKEIEATEAFLKQDEETRLLLERLERQKQDEELAKRLQEEENNKERDSKTKGKSKANTVVNLLARKLHNSVDTVYNQDEDERLARRLQEEEEKLQMQEKSNRNRGAIKEKKTNRKKFDYDGSPLRSQKEKSEQAKNIFKTWMIKTDKK